MGLVRTDTGIAYAEAYAILCIMEKAYLDKVPKKLKQAIYDEMDKDYEPKINFNIPLSKQKLNERTYNILGMIQLNYWCDNEEQKRELITRFSENDKRKEKEIREKYNPDDLFKNRNNKIQEDINTEENITAMVEYKENVFKRIINKIKGFFWFRY